MSPTGIAELKQAVKRLAAEGCEIRKQIQAEEDGPSRHVLWLKKREVGRKARVYYLAYGLARGVPYEVIERRTKTDPQGTCVCQVLRKYFEGELYTLAGVRAWLTRVTSKGEAA